MNSYNNYGRYSVTRPDGRKFVVQPIVNKDFVRKVWGDEIPGANKIEGNYGQKHVGGIPEAECSITPENGFTNIVILPPGESPNSWIEEQ